MNNNTVLEGKKLKLEPLSLSHVGDLGRNLLTKNAWHLNHWCIHTPDDLIQRVRFADQEKLEQKGFGFAMVVKQTNEAVGMSRLMEYKKVHKCIEIGGTWIGEEFQKSFVNTEAKFLMLQHCFENLGCIRVEFKVDALNFNSQKAVLRIGAKYEGELRSSCILPDGRIRDYRIYSITHFEWPNIKQTLKWYMSKYDV